MKIKFKENGVERELEVSRLRVIDKDGYTFRIRQDIERGIEVLADTCDGTFCIEPHVSNEITLCVRKEPKELKQ